MNEIAELEIAKHSVAVDYARLVMADDKAQKDGDVAGAKYALRMLQHSLVALQNAYERLESKNA